MRHWGKAAAVLGAYAQLLDGLQVGGSAVAFVLGKAVAWVLGIERGAVAVAADFGKDGCGRDGGYGGIALHDCFGTHFEYGQAVAIYQHFVGQQAQAFYGAAHGKQGGLQDVEAVYFFNACPCD